jgi:hypothetical protein
MEKISDSFELESLIERVREYAGNLPESKDSLTSLLEMLISDALLELNDEKFEIPKLVGDLDDADGINHLLTDYGPTQKPGQVFREAFLRTNEEAAACLLLKLYLARDSVQMDFGLTEDDISWIEKISAALLNQRLYGDKYDLGKNNTEITKKLIDVETSVNKTRKKVSLHQSKRASALRTFIIVEGKTRLLTKEDLEAFRLKFEDDALREGKLSDHGWRKPACMEFGISDKTLSNYYGTPDQLSSLNDKMAE